MEVRRAHAGDVGTLARVLAAAFADDPVWRWMVAAGTTRTARMQAFFALELEHVALPAGNVWTTADRSGAALVMPPDKWRMPVSAQARHAFPFARVFGRRLPLALGLLTRMEARHLRKPHLYLAYVGVDPGAQGRGIGRKILAPMLDEADAQRLPAYLESSNPRNNPFYERLGFTTTDAVRFAGSPPMALMRRDPA